MVKSLCKGKRTSQPNRCKKLKGCKVAKGTKRTFCRKSHNKTKKRKAVTKKRGRKRLTEVERLREYNVRQAKTLRRLK